MFQSKSLAKINWLIVFLCHFYLLVDATNGFLLNTLGTGLGLSIVYKTILIFLVMLAIGLDNTKHLSVILALIITLLIGPLVSFLRFSDLSMLGFDIAMVLKVVAMGVFFTYFYQMLQQAPEYMNRKVHSIVIANYFVVLVNFVLAVMGFGFAAYGEGRDEEYEIGFKGFFYAANELSPVLFVLTAYLMQFFWNKSKPLYFLTFLGSFICAGLMLTKTGILSCIILLVAIPIFNEREKLFKLTFRKIFLLSFLFLLCVLVIFNFESLLRFVGIYDKIMFFYNKDGLLGVILSARDKYAAAIWSVFSTNFSGWGWFVGVGGSGIEQFTPKYSAEIDSFDIYVWYGLIGLSVFVATLLFPLARAAQIFSYNGYPYVPALIVISLVLIFVSQAAGHVVTSGMLGMIWGMVAARSLVNIALPSKRIQPSKDEPLC